MEYLKDPVHVERAVGVCILGNPFLHLLEETLSIWEREEGACLPSCVESHLAKAHI